MNNNIKKLSTHLIVALVVMIPLLVFGQDNKGLIPCDGVSANGGVECTWTHFFQVIGDVMKYVYILAFSISTVLFAYAGILLMTSQGDTGKVTQAKGIFKNVIIGITIMFLSYWVVWTILKGLKVDVDFYKILKG